MNYIYSYNWKLRNVKVCTGLILKILFPLLIECRKKMISEDEINQELGRL
jgi:hypothetical protein